MMQLEGLEIQHKMWELNSVLTLNTKSVRWSQHTITNWKVIFSRQAFCDSFGTKEKCSSTWIFSSRHSVRLTLRKRISSQGRTSGEHSLLSFASLRPTFHADRLTNSSRSNIDLFLENVFSKLALRVCRWSMRRGERLFPQPLFPISAASP